ncbi:MAG: ABC transporter permease [Thermaerobacter sp.]|nr:ABC transporter permease [Thermaerobacter sp.]MDA8144794.1 ABC transporter permease [Thermaerobacter sp.]
MRHVQQVAARVLRQLSRDRRLVLPLLLLPLAELYIVKVILDALSGTPGFPAARYILPFAAFLVHFVAYLLCVLVLVRERTQGTLGRMFVAGYGRSQVVLGYALAYTVLVTLLTVEVLGLSVAIFSLYLSWYQITWVFVTFWLLGMASLALGILVSNLAKSESQVIPFIPLVILPGVLLSGMLLPVGELPAWAQALALLVPLRYAVPVLHALVLADTGIKGQYGYLLALVGWTLALLLLAGRSLPGDAAQEVRGSLGIRLGLALAVLSAAGVGVGWLWYQSTHFVSTDDAYVAADLVRVGPLTSSARVAAVEVRTGEKVRIGQPLALLDRPSPAGTPVRAVLEAPAAGRVVAHLPAGTLVAPGQAVVTLVDLQKLWIYANVPEGQVFRIGRGDAAVVHVDAWHRNFSGRVAGLVPATAALVQGLPPNNATAIFSKVAQTVPVRIDVKTPGYRLLPGLSAEVTIATP